MSFRFYMPTKVFIGKDVVLEKSNELKKLGNKALIVTGKNSAKKNGSLDHVVDALNKEGLKYVLFEEVEENPSIETVCNAANLGRKEKVDFIIGIGGGSPIDASKAIGVMIKNSELTKDTLFSSEVLNSVPIVSIPTTAGTGTETTQYSILTDHANKTKRNLGQEIFADIALVDASYMMGMSDKITRNTAIDALSHIIEGYVNTNANIITDGLCENALKIWGECIPALLSGDFTFEVREKLLIASNLAGMIIAQTVTNSL